MSVLPPSIIPSTGIPSTGLSRRDFLLRLQAMGGLLLVTDGFQIAKAADAPPKYGAAGMPHGTVDNPQVFVMIGDDGTVTIVVHRSEMGQGVRTGMPLNTSASVSLGIT